MFMTDENVNIFKIESRDPWFYQRRHWWVCFPTGNWSSTEQSLWSSVVKIQYTELKLSCGNDPVVKNYIYSNGDLDLWPNDPKINRVLPLPQENHVAKFGKDPMYRTKVIVRKPVWTPGRPPPARHAQSHNTARLETGVLKWSVSRKSAYHHELIQTVRPLTTRTLLRLNFGLRPLTTKNWLMWNWSIKALLHDKASIAILVSCNFVHHDPCQFTH
jgi:hypothetical protein